MVGSPSVIRSVQPRTRRGRTKPTVLVLADALGVGGSERQLFLLLSELSARDAFELHVVAFNRAPGAVLNHALEDSGVSVEMVPAECRSKIQRLRFLRRFVRWLGPDVIHSWIFHTNAYAAIIGSAAGVKGRIGSLRSLLSLAYDEIGRPLSLVSLFSVPRLLVNSNAIFREVVAAGYPAQRITLLENCVVFDQISPAEPQRAERELPDLGLAKDDLVVGAIGNLRVEKEHHLLVQAVARLVGRFPRLRAVIVGTPITPSVSERLEQEIRKQDLGKHLVLAGFRDDVPALLRRFDVFCITSRSEGSPNVVLEAMAAQCPVVATAVGGILELVEDRVTGLLFPPGDVERLAEAIRTLLEDRTLARRMALAGLKTVQHRTCESAADRLTELYRAASGT
jgi:glycosyltransferase involved in cell wall biosynthesis